MPFLISALLAELINPVVTVLSIKTNVSRSIVVTSIIVVFCIFLGIIMSVIITKVIFEINDLSSKLLLFDKSITQIITDVTEKKSGIFSIPQIIDFIISNQEKIYTSIQSMIRFLMNIAKSIPNISVTTLIVLISTFFIVRDRNQIIRFLKSFVPKRWNSKIIHIQSELLHGFLGYIKAQILLMIITFFVSTLFFSMFKVKYAWLLGIACGILDIIPMIGPSFMIFPWSVLMYITGNIPLALKLIIALCLISIVREICSANIVGKTLSLHPLSVIMAVYIGLKLLGPVGFILGPFVLILIRALYNIFIEPTVNKYN